MDIFSDPLLTVLTIFYFLWNYFIFGNHIQYKTKVISIFHFQIYSSYYSLIQYSKQFYYCVISCEIQAATSLKITLIHECFLGFLNCANSTKSHNASHLMITKSNNVDPISVNLVWQKLALEWLKIYKLFNYTIKLMIVLSRPETIFSGSKQNNGICNC